MFEAIERFRQKLSANQICVGAGVTLADSAIVEALAPCVDFLWIDLEHSHLSYESVQSHLIAARAGNVAALVRVRGSDVAHLKPVLDIGAEGIIVPQVRSVEEVRRIVEHCRYAPLGRRGYGPRRPSDYGRTGGEAYMRRANELVFVAVQIENAEALEAVEEIAAIEGLDSLALGPYDLSITLGHAGELTHPKVIGGIKRIVAAARNAGKFVGTGMGGYGDGALSLVDYGLQWIQCGDDYGYMIAQAESMVAQIRKQTAAR